jgi:glycosyltransferase involved in cell wall biosynthesis
MMRIGIDARFLTNPQRGGFKTYTENLVHAIHQLDDDHQYFIYVDRPIADLDLPPKDNFTCRVISRTLPVVGMPFREQVLLPIETGKDKIDILHSLCNTAPVRVSARKVITLHDTIQVTTENPIRGVRSSAGFKEWALMAYSKWSIIQSIRSADRVLTVSDYEKSQIVQALHICEQKIVVAHLSAERIFRPASVAEKARLRSDMADRFHIERDFLLGIGYEPRKNIPLIVQAFKEMSPGFPELDLVIVAAEPTRRLHFQQLARDLQLDGRVRVLGSVSPAELAALYNLAKAFIFPSERESFGLPPLEALACGTPTIAMNATSLPEILQDGAVLIDGNDVSAWAKAIEQVLRDEDLRKGLIDRGLRRAGNLTWQRCAQKTLDVYRSVLEES